MDIAKLRKQTAAACAAVAASRAATAAALDAEFNNSPLKEYIDCRIQEAANKGKSELSLNFFDIKERERLAIGTVVLHSARQFITTRTKASWCIAKAGSRLMDIATRA